MISFLTDAPGIFVIHNHKRNGVFVCASYTSVAAAMEIRETMISHNLDYGLLQYHYNIDGAQHFSIQWIASYRKEDVSAAKEHLIKRYRSQGKLIYNLDPEKGPRTNPNWGRCYAYHKARKCWISYFTYPITRKKIWKYFKTEQEAADWVASMKAANPPTYEE